MSHSNRPREPGAAAVADRGPVEDVEIISCEVDPSTRWPSAGLTITNNSGRTSTYVVSVEFVAASGTRLAEGAGISGGLAAGQRAQVEAASLTQVTEEVVCKVVKVDRIAP